MLSLLNWIIIGIFVALALILLRFEHFGRQIKIILLVLLGLLIYFSIAHLFTLGSLDLSSPKAIANSIYVYFGWIGRTLSSLWEIGTDTVKTVGNAISFNLTST